MLRGWHLASRSLSGTSASSRGLFSQVESARNVLAIRSRIKQAGVNDPFKQLASELASLRTSIVTLLGSSHPSLDTVAKYYFGADGKSLRPLIVMLWAQATAGMSPQWSVARRNPDESLEPDEVLNDINPSSITRKFSLSAVSHMPDILPTQMRLAEICEMIHVATLLHDDVIDLADKRRGLLSAPRNFGNKLSILAGDFLLGRASLNLSRLGSLEVSELIASILTNLVEGEVMQLQQTRAQPTAVDSVVWSQYLQKSYLKTASLMAKSARGSVILGGCGKAENWAEGERWKTAAYSYGRELGLAFQIVDDLLDFTNAENANLGKPGEGADLRLGLVTAPVLFAWEENSGMAALVARGFGEEGDVESALLIVRSSSSLSKTFALAEKHVQAARLAIQDLPHGEAKEGLEALCDKVLTNGHNALGT